MKKVITTGKTVELATALALQKLGVSRDRVTISVLKQPSRGLFGLIGVREAEVQVEVLPLKPLEETRQFVEDVLSSMNVRDVQADVVQTGENTYTIRLSGPSIGLLIGRRGATLDALQYLVNLVANKHSEEFVRVMLDAEDYRLRRKETLEKLAERLANKARQQRREVALEPMSSTERKIIHAFLQGRSDVVTYSQGDEPYRKVVIAPKERGRGKSAKPKGSGPRRQKQAGQARTPQEKK